MSRCSIHLRRIVYLTLALTLWLSYASAEHLSDFESEHHNHHSCEQFSATSHGVKPSVPVLGISVQSAPKHFEFSSIFISRVRPVEKARSPPV
ncbi:DUF2607 family protein [Vibrio sp. HN007]|uniref:DUF2607 family protein n=1 Tax=Vibrio iocasae TaxID=3098914 RepID=UPI0035D4E456